MIKKVREIEINKPKGTFKDIVELYKWLGKISTSSASHNFDIRVSIVETYGTGEPEPKSKPLSIPVKKKEPVSEMAVGEIREYDGKKFRCVKSNLDCQDSGCAFFKGMDELCDFPLGHCADDYRSDNNNVIFEEAK